MRMVVGNFKMNLNSLEIDDYINFFKEKELNNVVFGPPSIYLERFIKSGLIVTSQDVGFASKGAYTGDISAQELKSIGVTYSIVGHSERRKYYNDDRYVNDKIKILLDNEIVPILCIGETKEERENNKTYDVLSQEISDALHNIDTNLLNNVIIAYEPIWSIGTGIVPTNNDIYETISFIKKFINETFNVSLKVLYGGSVNNECINTLEKINNIDGYLVGGCSIKREEFDRLIKSIL